ncbi:hypothetical protein LCGC14_0396450 [marine sediment metagenome]|uniref:Uncharacterized protein n=1 Tax=marine sediment metagenome TaxID=412755 RepID=A0A0F9W750_9ZZZZ
MGLKMVDKTPLDCYTQIINAIVKTLKVEMDGGFLEDTSKYIGKDEELIYSCMRAIAVQIYAENAPLLIEKGRQMERERILRILREPLMYFVTEKLNAMLDSQPTNTMSRFVDEEAVVALEQAIKEGKDV